jgi:N-acetylneuraminate synthase
MHPTLIIAEAGVNHNGDLQLAKELVKIAADAGADIVKFQTFKAEQLVSKSAQKATYQQKNMANDHDNSQFTMLKKLELSQVMHHELIECCAKHQIQFLSTAFDLESLHFLHQLGLEIFKIPSGEITNLPYLQQIGAYKKQIILSTGMATMEEIGAALSVLTTAGTPKEDITVLHCNTEYPTPMQDVNLRAMQTIQQTFGVKIGYSDHTAGIEVATAAVALGATVIEKHFTIDKTMEGPDHKASLDPEELKAMVRAIRNIQKALGSNSKQPSPSEAKNIEITRKSIHLAADLPQGHCLTLNDLVMKRPAKGISPMELMKVIGKKLVIPKKADDFLSWTDIE